MSVEPGQRAVVAFASPCCGASLLCGEIVTVRRVMMGRDVAKMYDMEPKCMCGASVENVLGAEIQEHLWMHASRLIPLPPEEDMNSVPEKEVSKVS